MTLYIDINLITFLACSKTVPCSNGGRCTNVPGGSGKYCVCPKGFAGTLCDQGIS